MTSTTSVRDFDAAAVDREEMRYQAFCADRMLAMLESGPGDKILDVGAGTGVLALSLAQAVSPGGRVTAIDTAEPLLARLESKIRQFGIGNIDVHRMPAHPLEFRREYFRVVTCALASLAPPAMLPAAREWWRVLQPGGHLLCSVFAREAFQPFAGQLREALSGIGAEPNGYPWMPLAEPGVLAGILQEAGFDEVTVTPAGIGYHLPDAAAWWQVVTHGPLRAWLAPLDDVRLRALRSRHLAEVEHQRGENGLWLDVPVLIARAAKTPR